MEYLFEHIANEHLNSQREELYQVYVTDSLQKSVIALVALLGQEYNPPRFYDLLHQDEVEEDSRSADEIIEHIRKKLEE